ncbi:uncharacterized protein LOC131876717 [Cryptomeria japonica]|uniref:uncharacterized protein LOC131876717 n=1 Tax=Cryptomeria japonica TaxID=3369 RepID=UPI0027DA1784|nr:uncharacterized protein LOC131876717 [Cryptomeria japonica]
MERHPKIFWSPCAVHCLDLMLEDIGKLGWVKECVERAKNICKFIYNHALVLSIMRQYTGERELARPGITRFASNFLTLKSLLKSKASLRRMFVGEEWTSSSYATTTAGMDVVDCIFDEPGFWIPCAEIVHVTEPLVVLLRVVDGEKPAVGYIYEGMDRAKEAIRSIYAGVEDKYRPIWDIIDRRWHNQLHRPIHAAAYYLNPSFRFRADFKADEEVLSGLYSVVQWMDFLIEDENPDPILETPLAILYSQIKEKRKLGLHQNQEGLEKLDFGSSPPKKGRKSLIEARSQDGATENQSKQSDLWKVGKGNPLPEQQ